MVEIVERCLIRKQRPGMLPRETYFETSTKQGCHVDDAFQCIAKNALNNEPEEEMWPKAKKHGDFEEEKKRGENTYILLPFSFCVFLGGGCERFERLTEKAILSVKVCNFLKSYFWVAETN
ncbi:unnamed protein product [Malus baccata var. baccata]